MRHQAGSIKIYDCSSVNMTILMFSDVLLWNTHRHTLWLSCLSKQFASAVVQAYHWESVELMSVKNWRKVGLPHFFSLPLVFCTLSLSHVFITFIKDKLEFQMSPPLSVPAFWMCFVCVSECVCPQSTQKKLYLWHYCFLFLCRKESCLQIYWMWKKRQVQLRCHAVAGTVFFFLLFYMCVKETADDSLFL